jgi:hypothetical protein
MPYSKELQRLVASTIIASGGLAIYENFTPVFADKNPIKDNIAQVDSRSIVYCREQALGLNQGITNEQLDKAILLAGKSCPELIRSLRQSPRAFVATADYSIRQPRSEAFIPKPKFERINHNGSAVLVLPSNKDKVVAAVKYPNGETFSGFVDTPDRNSAFSTLGQKGNYSREWNDSQRRARLPNIRYVTEVNSEQYFTTCLPNYNMISLATQRPERTTNDCPKGTTLQSFQEKDIPRGAVIEGGKGSTSTLVLGQD